MATDVQIARLKRDWDKMAGERVDVEYTNGTFYGFCSELGALRIYYKYRSVSPDHIEVNYSENLKSWYFRLEVLI